MDITEDTPIACLTVKQFIDIIKNNTQPHTPSIPEQKEPSERLYMKDVRELTGYSRDTIYNLVRQLKIPHYRYAETGRLWFKRSEIIEWIDQQKIKTIEERYNERKTRF